MKRAGALIALALLAGACGGGATPANGAATPRTGGTLTIAQESEINTLDPGPSGLLVEREIFYNLYDSLLAIDTKLNIVADLATSWEFTDDRTLVLSLRHGVKFQDGTTFDAGAVVFNIERYLTAPDSARRTELGSVQSVEARDPYTAVLHLSRPDATLLAQLTDRAGMMLSPTAVRSLGAGLATAPAGAGSGPFEFVEWMKNDHLTLRRNPDYWRRDAAGRRLPYLDGIVYRPIPDTAVELQQLRAGALDMASRPPYADVNAVRSDRTLVYRELPGLGYNGIELNRAAPPFDDPAKVRAVELAIDRAQIVSQVIHDVGVVSYGPLTPASWAYDPTEKIYDHAQGDAAKAAATGFAFTLKIANTPEWLGAGQLIQTQLASAGITVTLQAEDFGTLNTETRVKHRFQAAVAAWSGRIDPDGNLYAQFHTGGSLDDGAYSNPQVDALLEQGRVTADRTARKRLYQQAQRLLVGDGAEVFVYNPDAQELASTKVQNFTLMPDGIDRLAMVWKS